MGKDDVSDAVALSRAQVSGQIIIARANQQLAIQHGIKALDVTRISRLGKSRVDSLVSLERRVIQMRQDLRTLHVPSVVDEISSDLRLSNHAQADSKFAICSRCDRKILIRLFAAHDTACARLKNEDTVYQGVRPVPFVGPEVQQLIDTFATFVPQPPRNCTMVAKGASFIEWAWEPPVFDGGLPIIDYEISYVAKLTEFDKEKGKFKKGTEVCPSLRTSQWCLLQPVFHKGYKMIGLHGGTEYTELMLRCANILGWSDWLPMTAVRAEEKKRGSKDSRDEDEVAEGELPRMTIRTEDADAPGPPMFFVCSAITSTCLHLQFDPPVRDGGSTVTEYLIFYTVLERRPNSVSREVFVEVSNRVRVKAARSGTTHAILRNICSDSDVVAIRVKAVSKIGLVGEVTLLGINLTIPIEDKDEKDIAVMPPPRGKKGLEPTLSEVTADGHQKGVLCHTLVSSRHGQLIRALNDAEDSSDAFIDTDFYTGVQQRLQTVDFIRQLKSEISVTPEDAGEAREQREWTAILDAKRLKREEAETEKARQQFEIDALERKQVEKYAATDMTLQSNGAAEFSQRFPFQQRRAHFKARVRRLEQELLDLKNERQEIDQNRGRLTLVMQMRQIVQTDLRIEKDRVSRCTGDLVTSSAINGTNVQYQKADFFKIITTALDSAVDDIANTKYRVIADEKRKTEIRKELLLAEEKLKDRQAAFLDFTHQYAKTMKETKKARKNMNQSQSSDDSYGESSFFKGRDKQGHRRASSGHQGKNENLDLLGQCFVLWGEYMAAQLHFDTSLDVLFDQFRLRYLRAAYFKWSKGEFSNAIDKGEKKDVLSSVGDVMLRTAQYKREELQADLRVILAASSTMKLKVKLVELTKENRKTLVTSAHYGNMEEGMELQTPLVQTALSRTQEVVNKAYESMALGGVKANSNILRYLFEGDGYTDNRRFDAAKQAYENQIMVLRSCPSLNLKLLSICHGRLGRMFLAESRFDRAIVDFDRQLSLAKEISDDPEIAEANLGIGSGYIMKYDFEGAMRYLDKAQGVFSALGNTSRHCVAMRAIQNCYSRLGKEEEALECGERVSLVEGGLDRKMNKMDSMLKDLRNRLVKNSTVASELIVKIERTTLRAVQLRNLVWSKVDAIEDAEEELGEQRIVVSDFKKLLDSIQIEMRQAHETNEIEMISHLVHAVPQMVEVEELKTRLASRTVEEGMHLTDAVTKEKKITTQISNLKDELSELNEELSIEEGNLMKHTRLDRPFRCIAFCKYNQEGNEVTGTASDGVEWYIASEGSCIHCIDYHNGECLDVILGGDKRKAGSAITGHSGIVTCLVHDGTRIYSGGTDEIVLSWDSKSKELLHVFRGHEGGIVALAVCGPRMASASADTTIRLWDKETGEMMRILHGHSRSVLALDMGDDWLLSGGQDEEVRVWAMGKRGKLGIGATCVHRLIGHEAAVTCVRYGKLEVMSGDCQGRVFMWWMDSHDSRSGEGTPYILHKIQVHSSPVKCLQFDALHIVSGGTDATLCVTDIATGDVMQTIRAHENLQGADEEGGSEVKKRKEKKVKPSNQVLAVAFDAVRIISAGTDNHLRYWEWGKKVGVKDKHHVLDKGQTLVTVSKLHNVTLDDLMKWNGVIEMRQAFEGMKLIVRKGNPDEPTRAEKIAIERERRKIANIEATAKKKRAAGMKGPGSGLVLRSRVERFATNTNKTSIANRMSSKAKEDCELFPDPLDTYKDPCTLTARIARQKTEDSISGGEGKREMETYYLRPQNESEWGPVSDLLAEAMLRMLCEYEAYDVAKGVLAVPREKMSMVGRMHANAQRELKRKEMEEKKMLDGEGAVPLIGDAVAAVVAVGTVAPSPRKILSSAAVPLPSFGADSVSMKAIREEDEDDEVG